MFKKLSEWYEKNLTLNRIIVATLFGWQLFHLYWLTTSVLAEKILGFPIFNPDETYRFLLVVADYFEIPALISGTLLYFYSIRRGDSLRNLAFVLLINSQWLHLFWITDEFVIDTFRDGSNVLPAWLAWVAIFIDYLELPVIYATIKDSVKSFARGSH